MRRRPRPYCLLSHHAPPPPVPSASRRRSMAGGPSAPRRRPPGPSASRRRSMVGGPSAPRRRSVAVTPPVAADAQLRRREHASKPAKERNRTRALKLRAEAWFRSGGIAASSVQNSATMPILHDVTIVELMLARLLEQYIADAIRTIVLEFGVDDMLLTVWDHFELSDCSKIPIQQVTQNIDATIGIITTDVILFVPIASSQIKLVNDKIRMAYTEVDGCSSGLNCDLFDFKKYLEEKGIVVKSSDDTLSSEADYIEIMNTSKTGEHKVAVTGPICQDFNNILGHLMSWWL